jgi:cysteine dioxygenase
MAKKPCQIEFGDQPWICTLYEQIKATIIMDSNNNLPKTFQSLEEFVDVLSDEGERTGYDNIFRSINLPISIFKNYCSWSNESYTRNCIVDNEKFELILLCWEPGQITPIHDHGGEECWVKIIDGDFREVIYQEHKAGELSVVKSSVAKTNDITYMIDFMGFHSLENLSNKRSMSLHFYAKPIRSCKSFDETSGKFIKKDLVYNTISEFEMNLK